MTKRYRPTKPFKLLIGRDMSFEKMMFTNYPALQERLEKLQKNGKRGNEDEKKHLAWLLERGEDRAVKTLCPCCLERPAKYFLAKYFFQEKRFTIGEELVFCKSKECEKKFFSQIKPHREAVAVLPIKFSSLDKFISGKDRKKLASLLKKLFHLEHSPTSEKLLDFFSE